MQRHRGHRTAPLQPLPRVRVTLTLPGGGVVLLGEATPHGRRVGFSVGVHVPADARAGTAIIRDNQSYPLTYRFRIRSDH